MLEEIPQATYGTGCLAAVFIVGEKMSFHLQVPQLSTMGQAELTGTLGPLVELVAMVKAIKNSSCDDDSSW